MIFPISKLKEEFYYWDIIRDMVDQCIDTALNLSQSGHPGGSRSKVPVLLATLLSGVMRWDIRCHPTGDSRGSVHKQVGHR